MIEDPRITRVNVTGYPNNSNQSNKVIDIACDVCKEYESIVKFKNTLLCKECAKEEGIKII
jgi:predicted GH43/DUF377 family glycosyl hydrolase